MMIRRYVCLGLLLSFFYYYAFDVSQMLCFFLFLQAEWIVKDSEKMHPYSLTRTRIIEGNWFLLFLIFPVCLSYMKEKQ